MAYSTRPKRPLRADACRNRERIIASAREVFALRGEHAQMSDIATHAEVGKGTLYRHFPDKESLLITVIRTRFDDLHAIVSQADEMEDPFHALKTALHATLRAIQSDTGLQLAIMCSSGSHHEDIEEQKTAFGSSMIRIVERAQRAGSVRSDLDFDDIAMVLTGIIATMYFKPSDTTWKRHLQLILSGLRPNRG